jgi:hypothetical protein
MINIEEKNIALITPDMYDYPKEIIKTLEYYGANVICFNDRPQNITSRFLRNVNSQLHDRIIDTFLKDILLKMRNLPLDFLVLIKGTAITSEFLKQFKYEHPQTKIIMYQWDSDKIHPYLHLVDFVDTCFVFDKSDLPLHPKLKYLPLFYIDSYISLRDSKIEMDIDLLHIGTLHEGRLKQINELEKQLVTENFNIYIYLLLPFTGWVKQIFKGKFYSRVKFISLTKLDILKLYKRSKAVLDIPQIGQQGLTLRTFEVLGAYKKLITTNQSILNEEIYIPELVYVINRDKRLINDFLKNKVVITDEIKNKIEKYSIHNWVNELFS